MGTGIRPVIVGCTLVTAVEFAGVTLVRGFRPSQLPAELIALSLLDMSAIALVAILTAVQWRRASLRPARRPEAPAGPAEPEEMLYWTGPYAPPEHDRVQLRIGEDRQIMEWEQEEREQINRLTGR